jgi:hypothetical protein
MKINQDTHIFPLELQDVKCSKQDKKSNAYDLILKYTV